MRENGLRVALFVDDFFQMMKRFYATDHRDFLLQTLKELGWSINLKKSQLKLDVNCGFVGFNVYSTGNNGPWLQVMSGKVKKLKYHLRSSLCNVDNKITARHLARIVGQCVAMTRAVLPRKLLLRNAYRCLSKRHSWHDVLTMDQHTITDLKWWLESITNWNGAPVNLKPVQV